MKKCLAYASQRTCLIAIAVGVAFAYVPLQSASAQHVSTPAIYADVSVAEVTATDATSNSSVPPDKARPSLSTVALVINNSQASSGEFIATDMDAVRSDLQQTAQPLGAVLGADEIVQLACNRSYGQIVTRITQSGGPCKKSSDACIRLRSAIIAQLVSRQQQVVVQRSLQAHYAVHATTLLAQEQLVALEQLDAFRLKQIAAEENGLPNRDPLSLDRLALQIADASAQIVNANSMARSQLSLLLDTSIACDYMPMQEAECRVCNLDLCSLIETAQRNRGDVRAIELLRNSLCEDVSSDWSCFAGLMDSNLSCSLLSVGSTKKNFLISFLKKSETEELQELRRRSLTQVLEAMRDKVASEVTTAWYEHNEALQRMKIADDLVKLATRRQQQLEEFGKEVFVAPAELAEAELSLRQARVEKINRLRECQAAYVELVFAAGLAW